ncbi:Uncharacterised protein [BD1-7 clade bacterium]|uniref:Peptidase M16C associated domain-containing protein n=1 Tax=BD1-7 clade bacterium TaxID=2029982 RepID=A0A5S9R2D1_9GAMM|nr:Uncharacterised protein [BD1-7 clade bacterium]
MSQTPAPSPHPAFDLVRSQPIEALQIHVEEYRHRETGALHYHMASDSPENVFLVALRTVPMDNKGVAHILEHTALCGSEKYPVRDPFFMMIRRSLNTFMNAFTSNDWTAYPFASQNRKDFDNLLDVYLDAVFFSRLDELDFMQEGHRLEFSEPENPQSPLTYKGVVFNEMKGAMSSVASVLWQTLCKHLFPSTTYHYNSGGDPEYITDLSYTELKDFYQAHYHPSNAIFMTFGDISAAEHQEKFESQALNRFNADSKMVSIGREKRLLSPTRIQEAYAFDSNDSTDDQTHLVIGWLLGKNTSLKDLLSAQLLSYVLLENSASPLQHYLETTSLGSAPSPLVGLEDSYHELVFVCGITGSEVSHADQFENDVMDIITKVADEGISLGRLEAILHQLELSQREIGGDGYPYGLQLILTALPSATHRGDPITLLDLEPVLEDLRESIKDPSFIKTLARELLLENQHRVSLTMTPDKNLSERRLNAEKQQLEEITRQLTPEQSDTIVNQAKALAERQAKVDDISILPKVGLADVPSQMHIAEGTDSTINNIPVHHFDQGTNGLVYQQIVMPLPELTDDELQLLPIYCQCLTEVGLGDLSFTDVQNRQSEVVGSINAFTSMRGATDDEQHVLSYLVISAKALARNQESMAILIKDTLETVHFNEHQRLKDIVSQNRQRKEQSITGNGHALAMTAASAGMSPLANINEGWGGMQGIVWLKQLDTSLQNETEVQALADKFAAIHEKVRKMPMQILSITEADEKAAIDESLTHLWHDQSTTDALFSPAQVREQVRVGWLANTQVNFCAKSYTTVTVDHPDSAALTVLGGFLRNGYLHTAIREKGGAYGAGASQDTNTASFRFYSYRDPRVAGTLDDFDASIDWLRTTEHTADALEESILGVVSSLDKPGSPSGEARQAFYNELFGRTPEQRQAFREAVLAVTLDDLKRVSATYLKAEQASIAVISNETHRQELADLGLELRTL